MKKIIKKVVKKIGSIIYKPFKYLKGKKFLNIVIKNKKDDEIYVFLSDLIGDFVIGMSCIEYFIDAHKDKKVILVTQRDIFSWYPQLNGKCQQYKYDDFYQKYKLDNDGRCAFMQNSRLSNLGLKHNILNTVPCFFKECLNAEVPWGLVQTRKYIFKLNDVNKVTSPIIQRPSKFNYNLKKNDIIINPYSNSLKGKGIEIYQDIANLCIKKGYNVYTNVLPNQKELKGTKRLDCKLDELYYISQDAKAIISVRSGVLDYLGFTNTHIIAVYDNVNNIGFKETYCMDQFAKDTIKELHIGSLKGKESRNEFLVNKLNEFGI